MADNQPFGSNAYYIAARTGSNQTVPSSGIRLQYNSTVAGNATEVGFDIDTTVGVWTKPDSGVWLIIAGYEIGDLDSSALVIVRIKAASTGGAGGTTIAENRHTNARGCFTNPLAADTNTPLRQLGQVSTIVSEPAGTQFHVEAISFDQNVTADPQFRALTTSRIQLIKIAD